ncbi:thioredoxin domain-containing protein, partial [Staphylococcus aureus]
MKKISIFLILFIFCTILVVLFRHNSEKEDEKEIFFSKNLEEKYTLHSPKLGNSSKNKIIVFEDFKCPHCRTLYNNI